MEWLPWVLAGIGLVLLGILVSYWAIVLTEGAYIGARAVRAIYDWGAPTYDEVKQYEPTDEYWFLGYPLASRLAETAAFPMVLDVATGTARLPLALSRVTEFDGTIVGLDLAGRMLDEAARKTQGHQRRISFVHHPASPLPFADNAFHAVTMLEALEFLPHPQETLREMVRVLQPGGWMLVSNRIGNDASWFPRRAYSPDRFEGLLRSFGLDDVHTKPWQEYYDLIWAQKPGAAPQAPDDLALPPAPAPTRRAPKPGARRQWQWLAALRCPQCQTMGQWEQQEGALACKACQRAFPMQDRIIHLVV